MEECDLIIVVYACYTIEKYAEQIKTIMKLGVKNVNHIIK
jgi:hypothetical protein